MREQVEWDACCLQEHCVRSGRAFFNRTIDSGHEKALHSIIPLRASEFQMYFAKGDKQEKRNSWYDEKDAKVAESIVQAMCLKLQKYAKKCMIDMKQKFYVESVSNAEELVNGLRAGNYGLVKRFAEYKCHRHTETFCEYLWKQNQRRQSLFLHYLVTIQLEVEKYMRSLCQNAAKTVQQKEILNSTDVRKDQQNQERKPVSERDEGYVPAIDEEDLVDYIAEFQLSEENDKKKIDHPQRMKDREEPIEQQKIKMEEEQCYSEINFSKLYPSNSSDRQQNKEHMQTKKHNKTKRIEKEEVPIKKRKSKLDYFLSKSPSSNDKDNKQVEKQEKQQKQQKAITVLDITNPEQILQKIITNHADLQVLHILDHKFAVKSILQKVLQRCSNLHTLTISCDNEFSVDLLKQLSPERLSRFRRIELKWNMERFFMEYQLFKHFSIKRRKKIQRFSKIQNFFEFWERVGNNESLWFQSNQMIAQFNKRGIPLNKIKYLSFAPSTSQRYGDMNILPRLVGLNNLLTLSLVQIHFQEDSDPFGELISKNKNIKSIIIYGCIGLNLDKAIKNMAELPCLTNLALSQFQNQSLKVKPRGLFKLVNLKELYLDQINFVDKVDQYNSSKCLQDIRQLKKLTHLSLYACNPVFSDIFQYISVGCQRRMKYLCLGYTCVDKMCLNKIVQMEELEYLDIDAVEITGQDLIRSFRHKYHGALSSSPLKYLSLEEPIKQRECIQKPRISVAQLKQLSKYLSNLVYLDIAGCHNIEGFSFECFISLNKLVLDKVLAQKLRKYVVSTIKIFKLDET